MGRGYSLLVTRRSYSDHHPACPVLALAMPRQLIEPHKSDKRYVRRKGGKFTKSQDDVGRSLAVDRRKHAKQRKAAKATGAIAKLLPGQFEGMDKHIPRIKNVDLVPEAKAHGAAPGFTSHFAFVVSVGLILGNLALLLIACMIFRNQVHRTTLYR